MSSHQLRLDAVRELLDGGTCSIDDIIRRSLPCFASADADVVVNGAEGLSHREVIAALRHAAARLLSFSSGGCAFNDDVQLGGQPPAESVDALCISGVSLYPASDSVITAAEKSAIAGHLAAAAMIPPFWMVPFGRDALTDCGFAARLRPSFFLRLASSSAAASVFHISVEDSVVLARTESRSRSAFLSSFPMKLTDMDRVSFATTRDDCRHGLVIGYPWSSVTSDVATAVVHEPLASDDDVFQPAHEARRQSGRGPRKFGVTLFARSIDGIARLIRSAELEEDEPANTVIIAVNRQGTHITAVLQRMGYPALRVARFPLVEEQQQRSSTPLFNPFVASATVDTAPAFAAVLCPAALVSAVSKLLVMGDSQTRVHVHLRRRQKEQIISQTLVAEAERRVERASKKHRVETSTIPIPPDTLYHAGQLSLGVASESGETASVTVDVTCATDGRAFDQDGYACFKLEFFESIVNACRASYNPHWARQSTCDRYAVPTDNGNFCAALTLWCYEEADAGAKVWTAVVNHGGCSTVVEAQT
jgi:hypothetical protein